VSIEPGASKGTGRIVIHYATLDQLDSLIAKLR